MREYKFRAWDNEANLMIYSDHRNRKLYDVCYYFETDSKGELKCNWEAEWTESCTPDGGAFNNLMQYTGLKDKNGVEIYEGDVVKYVDEHYEIAQDIFDKAYYMRGVTQTINIECNIMEQIEVIGNIYENEKWYLKDWRLNNDR